MTVLQFTASHDWETVKNVDRATVHRNWINLKARKEVPNSHQMLNYSDILFIYLLVYLSIYYLFIFLFIFLMIYLKL